MGGSAIERHTSSTALDHVSITPAARALCLHSSAPHPRTIACARSPVECVRDRILWAGICDRRVRLCNRPGAKASWSCPGPRTCCSELWGGRGWSGGGAELGVSLSAPERPFACRTLGSRYLRATHAHACARFQRTTRPKSKQVLHASPRISMHLHALTNAQPHAPARARTHKSTNGAAQRLSKRDSNALDNSV